MQDQNKQKYHISLAVYSWNVRCLPFMSLLGQGRKVYLSELYEGLWVQTVCFGQVCLIHWVWVQTKSTTKSLAHVSLSERWRSYWSMFIHRPHHTVIIDGVAKDSPQSIHPCVFVHPYIYICVCLPRVNRSQLPFFSPPLLLDTVSYHPFPCHDMELFGWNCITMRNVSTRLWNATAQTWDQERAEAKEAEEEDRFWKMEDDFSKDQTPCERHRFQGNLVTYDEGSSV